MENYGWCKSLGRLAIGHINSSNACIVKENYDIIMLHIYIYILFFNLFDLLSSASWLLHHGVAKPLINAFMVSVDSQQWHAPRAQNGLGFILNQKHCACIVLLTILHIVFSFTPNSSYFIFCIGTNFSKSLS